MTIGGKNNKKTNMIMLVATSVKDPAREKEFNEWYDNEHVPDILSGKLVHRATRWKNSDPASPQPAYFAIYETESTDPKALWADIIAAFGERKKSGKGGRNFDSYNQLHHAYYVQILDKEAE